MRLYRPGQVDLFKLTIGKVGLPERRRPTGRRCTKSRPPDRSVALRRRAFPYRRPNRSGYNLAYRALATEAKPLGGSRPVAIRNAQRRFDVVPLDHRNGSLDKRLERCFAIIQRR